MTPAEAKLLEIIHAQEAADDAAGASTGEVNRASEVGWINDCPRYLVKARLTPDARVMDEESRGRFAEGRRQEYAMRAFLKRAQGIKIQKSDEPFYVPELELRGDEDNIITIGDRTYVVDYKSASEAMYRQIRNVDSVEDMKKSDFPYMRHYPFQMNAYMVGRGINRAMFLFKSKETGQWRPVECPYRNADYKIIQDGLADVNRLVAKGEIPNVEAPMDVCEYCDFKESCWGDREIQKETKEISSAELYGLLVERDLILKDDPKPAAKRLKEIEDRIREGAFAFGPAISLGKYRIFTGRTPYKTHEYPPEIQKQYETKGDKWKPIKIEIDEGKGL
jgi:CRISPR/Cas system-associated exonuclease Cas4 (RecB family)